MWYIIDISCHNQYFLWTMSPCPRGKKQPVGVHSVKFKAQAALIRTFMETAANPKFRHSLLHSHLFQYHVLGETSLPDPGFLPYYPVTFFQTIKRVHNETALNVKTMSTSQWARVLIEDGLTMEVTEDQARQYIPCKAELTSPQNDWELSWKHCRLTGLHSEQISFNLKIASWPPSSKGQTPPFNTSNFSYMFPLHWCQKRRLRALSPKLQLQWWGWPGSPVHHPQICCRPHPQENSPSSISWLVRISGATTGLLHFFNPVRNLDKKDKESKDHPVWHQSNFRS